MKSPRRIEGILQRIGQQEVELLSGEKTTRLEMLMERVYTLAEQGQQWAVAFVAERTEGKVRESRVEDDPKPLVPVDGLEFKAEPHEVEAGA